MAKSIDSILLNALKEIYYSFEHINIPGKSGGDCPKTIAT